MRKVLLLAVVAMCLIGCVHKSESKYLSAQDSIDEQHYVDSAMKDLDERIKNGEVETVSDPNSIINQGRKCYIISKGFVISKLKYPNESDFEDSQFVHERDGESAVIMNKFTCKNGYGVEISYVYKIWMNYNGGEWSDESNWTCNKLIIEGSDGTKQVY